MPEIELIRLPDPADPSGSPAPAVRRALTGSYDIHWRGSRSGSVALVQRAEGGTLGVTSLEVNSDVRRQGVARSILRAVETAAVEAGVGRLSTTVDSGNTLCLRLFGDAGFSVDAFTLAAAPQQVGLSRRPSRLRPMQGSRLTEFLTGIGREPDRGLSPNEVVLQGSVGSVMLVQVTEAARPTSVVRALHPSDGGQITLARLLQRVFAFTRARGDEVLTMPVSPAWKERIQAAGPKDWRLALVSLSKTLGAD